MPQSVTIFIIYNDILHTSGLFKMADKTARPDRLGERKLVLLSNMPSILAGRQKDSV